MSVTQVTTLIMWVAIAVNLISAWVSIRARKALHDRLESLHDVNIKRDISLRIHDELMERIGLSGDLVDRTITDLAFLHGQIYDAQDPSHHCPTCDATVPELEALRDRLQSVRVDVLEDRP